MNRILAFSLAMLILLCCGGCAAKSQEAPELLTPVGVEMDTAVVYRGSVCLTQTFEGRIVPRTQTLSFSTSGKLSQIHVNIGDTVEKGQVIARLDTADTATQIASLEQQIQNCRDRGSIAARKIQVDIQIAQTEYEMLRLAGADPAECEKKSASIAALELQLKQREDNTKLQLSQLNKELSDAQSALYRCTLTAPFAGKVSYVSSARVGSAMGIDTVVVCLTDESVSVLQVPYMEESVLEGSDAVYAKVLDAQFPAKYVPYDQQEYVSMMLNQEQLYSHFILETESGVVQSGQYAVLFVEKATRQDTLLIPVNAILQDRQGQYVYKLTQGKRIRCDVQIGIVSETKAQVLSGLEEGDVVYVNS